MEEKKIIQDIIESREESMRFFSNSYKSKRERWVIGEFLKNLGISFSDNDLISVSNDPPDIVFSDAEFEIKEIDIQGRKRGDEYKKKLSEAKSAKSIKGLMKPYEFKEITLQEIVNRISKELEKLDYCLNFRKKTNLMFYVNYSLIGEHNYTIQQKNIWKQWRSISIVMNNNVSYTFLTTDDAPAFIKSVVGKLIIRGKLPQDK